MSNTRNILIHYSPGDNIDAVVDSALVITKGYDSFITFAYINEKMGKEGEVAQRKLQQIVNDRKLPTDKITYVLKEGKSFVEIVNLAKQQHTDTIVMRVEPKSSILNVFNENNPYQAVISAPCPVVTLTNNVKLEKVQHILVPIDHSELTRQKLPLACNVARHFGATIHILALSPEKTGEQAIRTRHYAEQAKKFIEEKGIKTTYDVVLGKNVCQTVLEFEESTKADLIIITADEETSFLFESCFEKVIKKSTIPVMSTQPKDTKVTWAGM